MRVILLLSICIAIPATGQASGATWHVAPPPLGSNSNPGTEELPFATIQHGIDASSDGNMVIVAEGIYVENIQFKGKNIVLTGTDVLNHAVVGQTIIDGNKAGSVVTFSGFESWECWLTGFTIRNGDTPGGGGGICGGTPGVHARAQIGYNVITGNSAEGCGGGLCYCDGTIRRSTITDNTAYCGGGLSDCYGPIEGNTVAGNSATEHGGGLFCCNGTISYNTIIGNSALGGGGLNGCGGTIRDNTITGNSATYYGGGIAYCNGPILNNTITGNEGGVHGGGLAYCDGAIQSNTIADNVSERGGGLSGCDGIIQNNKIASNWAEYGGGLIGCNGTIENSTIAGNVGVNGTGALSSCNGTIRNCIIWANGILTLDASSKPTYSCIEGWSGAGEGNIASQPQFLDLNAGDYRLQGGSPCIDVGFNDPDLPEFDIVGMHRIMFGGKSLRVDMGAWEYYINTLSRGPGGNAVVTWSSLVGKTYCVWTSSDPRGWHWTSEDTVPSLGDTVTTWTDTTAPFLSPAVRRRYYRTVEK